MTDDDYDVMDQDLVEGAYWRWAEEAVPTRTPGGWTLPVPDSRISHVSATGSARELAVEEWMYECFRAQFADEIVLVRGGMELARVSGATAVASAPLVELVGRPISSATLADFGEIAIETSDGITVSGRVSIVICDDRRWELEPSGDRWDLWIEDP